MGLDTRKPVFRVGKQQRRRPACVNIIRFLKKSYLNLLQFSSLCSRGDWFEYRFVRNPEDRFCHVEAHIS